jgi:hypothetical protein
MLQAVPVPITYGLVELKALIFYTGWLLIVENLNHVVSTHNESVYALQQHKPADPSTRFCCPQDASAIAKQSHEILDCSPIAHILSPTEGLRPQEHTSIKTVSFQSKKKQMIHNFARMKMPYMDIILFILFGRILVRIKLDWCYKQYYFIIIKGTRCISKHFIGRSKCALVIILKERSGKTTTS